MNISLPQIGELFESRYRVDAEIGEGGFSRVFRATDQSDGRIVALKILIPAVIDNGSATPTYQGDIAERFLREARMLQNIQEGHTIQLLNHGNTSDGMLFMVFEYVDGKSLFETIRDEGALPAEMVADILSQILQTLQAAHTQGILHRDIKPNNLMITLSRQVKVLDFGIAKAFADASPSNDLTGVGMLVGTPRYMAPEQLKGHQMGPAADLYSLGVVAVEMLTGKKAMRGKDRMDIIQQQLMPQSIKVPVDLDIPYHLREIVDRLLEKDLRVRYASAAAVLRDLQFWNQEVPQSDDTILGSVDMELLRSPSGDATVLTTVNMAELQRIHQGANNEDRTLSTTASNFAATWAPSPNAAATAPPIALGTNFGPAPASSASTSQIMQQFGSGQFPQPQQSEQFPQQQWGTGQFPQQAPHQAPTGFGSGSHPLHAHPAPNDYGNIAPNPTQEPTAGFSLSHQQKILLAVSFLIPGLAHVMFGQTKKGVLIFLAVLLTAGILYILSLAVVFDAYLVLRAQQYREVKDFEILPDSKSFFA
jgi:serine/threonine protein kinase